jgi:1-acyl-sn-glycerol-3-phosphate acyltransferase
MDIIINSKCICGQGLNWTNKGIVSLFPCGHLIHLECLKNYKCFICNKKITDYQNEEFLSNKEEYYQRYIDILSMKNMDNFGTNNNNNILKNFCNLLGVGLSLPFSRGYESGHDLCKNFFCTVNAEIIVKGQKNIKDINKVIIANHTNYFDFMVIYFIFKCGFLSSTVINESLVGQYLTKILPILIIKRGEKVNMVEQIKKYVQETGSICLFPEGLMSHPDTLINFRTGAFYTTHPVLPVIIKYESPICDNDIINFFKKSISCDKLKIYVHILPIEYPPFDNTKISEIRGKMAKIGNLALSRVSNRDIKD